MRTLGRLTLVEMKLFIREPITMFFTFALPLLFLFVMGGVFGKMTNGGAGDFHGLSAMAFYTPAYIALVLTSVGIVGLPGHLTGYRERGVLRRFRASSLSIWRIFGAQGLVSLVTAAIGGILILVAGVFVFHVSLPQNPLLVILAFLVSALSFTSLGLLLGAVLPTSRAAQGVGLVLFFVMLILGGAGPPPEAMTHLMRVVGDFTPMQHAVTLLQNAWLGLGWNWMEFGIMAGILIVSLTTATLVLRRNS
ncbi:MAG: ABC transporter permease [Dehalococcoidales bacterium]|jgi:ABC-2 type transport system permease protein